MHYYLVFDKAQDVDNFTHLRHVQRLRDVSYDLQYDLLIYVLRMIFFSTSVLAFTLQCCFVLRLRLMPFFSYSMYSTLNFI